MISETSSPSLAALPVRRRETLEIFDTALKLYRRYFWVLVGWSALVASTSLASYFASFLYIFVAPLLYGSVSCCVAAAVRGQSVRFRQCWEFTKPRYGAMLGVILLSGIIFFCALFVFFLAAGFLIFLGALALSNAALPFQVVGGIVGFLALAVFVSIMIVFAFGWMTMVPIVSCLEDDKRGTAAMGRALELLKGNWRRVLGMSLLIGLAVLAVLGIVAGGYSLIAGIASIRDLFNPSSATALTQLTRTMTGFSLVFSTFWSPAQTLIIAVLYLDLRVRREALDLEWSAYTSAPPVATDSVVLEPSRPNMTPLSSTPKDVGFAESGATPTSFAAGGNAAVESAVEVPEFAASSFSIPTPPSNRDLVVDSPNSLSAEAPFDDLNTVNVSPVREISLEKTSEIDQTSVEPLEDALRQNTPEMSGDNEGRREL